MIYFMWDNGTVTAFDEGILGTLPQKPLANLSTRFYASSVKTSSLLSVPIWLRCLSWKLLPWVSMESGLLETKTVTNTAKNLKPGPFHFGEKTLLKEVWLWVSELTLEIWGVWWMASPDLVKLVIQTRNQSATISPSPKRSSLQWYVPIGMGDLGI